MPNPSRLIRERAETLPAGDATRGWPEGVAAEFETQHNKQNNDWTVALGNAELAFDNKLDMLRADMERQFGDSEERQKKILELLEALQDDLRKLAGANDVRNEAGP